MMVIKSIDEFLNLLKSGKFPQRRHDVNLSGQEIDVVGATQLANALQSGKCPKDLQIDLSYNNIGVEGAIQIANALKSGKCPKGLRIYLSDNAIGANGVTQIANALQSGKCPKGLQIILDRNKIDDIGAKKIANALQSGKCPHGLEINLWGNKIGVSGGWQIVNALKSGKCPQGLQIDLGKNNIGFGCAWQIASALQSGKCPQGLQINLRDNDINNDGASLIADAILSGKCPVGLKITGVEYSFHLLTRLQDLLQPLLESEKYSDDAKEQSWDTFQKALLAVLASCPDDIYSATTLLEKIATVMQENVQSLLQQSEAGISEMPYREQYLPAFQQIADIVLALYNAAHEVPDCSANSKNIVSNILLTLEPALLPHTQRNILPDTQLWARGQQCLLLEKALTLSKGSRADTVILRRFQEFYDAFNNVPSTLENLSDSLTLASLQEDPKNAKAQAYLKELNKNGLQLPKPLTTRYGFFPDALAVDNKNDSKTCLKKLCLI